MCILWIFDKTDCSCGLSGFVHVVARIFTLYYITITYCHILFKSLFSNYSYILHCIGWAKGSIISCTIYKMKSNFYCVLYEFSVIILLNHIMFLPCFCRDPKCLNLDNILGFILNVPSDYKLGFMLLPLRRRHWVTIRQVHGTYYNLDSKLEFPQLIGRVSHFWQLAHSVLMLYLVFILVTSD
jgi:hypothetical protein